MAVYTLSIPGWIPADYNKLAGGYGWVLKKRDRIRVKNALRFNPIPPAEGRRRVTIIITFPKGMRRCDPDQYYKSTHDALVKAGLLVNDSVDWVQITPPVFLRGERKLTQLELEDVCGPKKRKPKPRKPKPTT